MSEIASLGAFLAMAFLNHSKKNDKSSDSMHHESVPTNQNHGVLPRFQSPQDIVFNQNMNLVQTAPTMVDTFMEVASEVVQEFCNRKSTSRQYGQSRMAVEGPSTVTNILSGTTSEIVHNNGFSSTEFGQHNQPVETAPTMIDIYSELKSEIVHEMNNCESVSNSRTIFKKGGIKCRRILKSGRIQFQYEICKKCDICEKTFLHLRNLVDHRRNHGRVGPYVIGACLKSPTKKKRRIQNRRKRCRV